jgi:uncharacterized membrane protein YhiD involved in acid resistance
MNQSNQSSGGGLLIGCGLIVGAMVISFALCGGCIFGDLSKTADTVRRADKRQVEAEQKQRAAQQALVKQAPRK